MELLLHTILLIPFLGFLGSLLIPEAKENAISRWTFWLVGLNLMLLMAFMVLWVWQGAVNIDIKDWVLYQSKGYVFFIDFFFDHITATFGIVGGILTFLITVYSRYYLHRETGYKRFFNTVWFFYLGYNLVVFSGNLETLFVGWEVLGMSSFLLISFYRDRYLPVKNAVRVFSIYRIGDVGLIMAMWLMHHLWHENITFSRFLDQTLVHEHIANHSLVGIAIALLIMLSAYAKSAQLPFSSWLPRAMEGPTPSSAIFYGSLSVHLGVFLMLRTYPFLEFQISARIFMWGMGLLTAFIATNIARVQSNVKSQIAYSSIAQIGLIFMEISMGWLNLALFHFTGNAFLRTYQLLVSLSVVSYLIREQLYQFKKQPHSRIYWLPKTWMNSLYILSLKEFNLEKLNFYLFWSPLKTAGRWLAFLKVKHIFLIVLPVALFAFADLFLKSINGSNLPSLFSAPLAMMGLAMVLRAFAEKQNVFLSWWLVVLNHCFIAISVAFNEHFTLEHVFLYLSGVIVFALIGHWVLQRTEQTQGKVHLKYFQGIVHQKQNLALFFLLAGLGLTGFPISPSFIGEDLIFSHIHENQWMLASLVALSYVVDGLAVIRIYSRVFLGPSIRNNKETAYRSS